jgi:hypothetical protein
VYYGSGSLGHEKLETTARYTRVATGLITAVESPLDHLSLPRQKPNKKAIERANKTAKKTKRRSDKSKGEPPA